MVLVDSVCSSCKKITICRFYILSKRRRDQASANSESDFKPHQPPHQPPQRIHCCSPEGRAKSSPVDKSLLEECLIDKSLFAESLIDESFFKGVFIDESFIWFLISADCRVGTRSVRQGSAPEEHIVHIGLRRRANRADPTIRRNYRTKL